MRLAPAFRLRLTREGLVRDQKIEEEAIRVFDVLLIFDQYSYFTYSTTKKKTTTITFSSFGFIPEVNYRYRSYLSNLLV